MMAFGHTAAGLDGALHGGERLNLGDEVIEATRRDEERRAAEFT
jgi:hypothetical protein